MDINAFIPVFADLFEETDVTEITKETRFHDLDEWSSLLGMSVIAMAKTQFNKTITGLEIRHCDTVEDLYNLINNK
jgi:acyl carrier protein